MQIVIDIPDRLYDTLPKIHNGSMASKTLLEFVKNGTPLPKGHGDLIDMDNITSITLEDSLHCLTWKKGSEIDCYIDAPIIIPAERSDTE